MGIRKPRADYNPDIPEYAVCPGCTLRLGGVITPACPICDGAGVIQLGRPALMYDQPEAVALAIRLTLTSSADAILKGTIEADTHRSIIPATISRLATTGLLERGTRPCPATTTSSPLPSDWPGPLSPPRARKRWGPTPGQLPLWPT